VFVTVQEFYDARSGELVRDYVVGNPRIEAQLDFFRRAIPRTAKRILEVGIGNGYSAHFIATKVARGAKIVGVDISVNNVEIARRLFPHRNIEYVVGDILEEDVAAGYDVVVFPDCYEHIPADSRGALHEKLSKVMADRGRVLLTVPSPAHQRMLTARGTGLQLVDEVVTLSDLVALAEDLRGHLSYYRMISVFRYNDYIHAVVDLEENEVRPITSWDDVEIKARDGEPLWLRTPVVASGLRKVKFRMRLIRARWALRKVKP
jgi:SAM-dependent methyltransferase